MRIGLVSVEYPPESGGGGIGTQTYLKAHGLAARGHEVHVISTSSDDQSRTYDDGRATIHRIAVRGPNLPCYEQSTYWLAYSLAVAEKLHALSQQIRFEVVQFPEYCGEGFFYQTDTFKYRKARYVVQCHGPLSMFAEHMGWPESGSLACQVGSFMERMVIRHSDLVLASSACTAAYCAAQYDYPVEKIHVVHSGIDTDRFVVRSSAPGEQYPKVLFVGSLTETKGFNMLLESVLGLRSRYPRIELRAIGKSDDTQLKHVTAQISTAAAQRNVDIKGPVPYSELPEHYAWCDMFAGPSVYEPGPGNVYLEAMACGKPVIACNSGGTPEVVTDGVTGLLIAPRNQLALETAIGTLAGDASLRERLGRNARAWVEANVSIARYIDKVERLYQQLLPA